MRNSEGVKKIRRKPKNKHKAEQTPVFCCPLSNQQEVIWTCVNPPPKNDRKTPRNVQ
jgi:hypothetical protein